MSYLIQKEDTSVTDRRNFRSAAMEAGIQKAIKSGLGDRRQLITRGFTNIRDAGAVLDEWRSAALAVAGNEYSVFQAVAAPVLAANKVAVFYMVQVETVPLPVSLLRCRYGGLAGNIALEFDLEQLASAWEMVGYFSEPFVVGPTGIFAINVVARTPATLVLAQVELGGFVIEPLGQTLSGNAG